MAQVLKKITYQSADGTTLYECTTPIVNAAPSDPVHTVVRVQLATANSPRLETYAANASGNVENCHPATSLAVVEALFA